MRKINQLLRKNKRELDASMRQLQNLRVKTEGLVKKAAKSKDPKSARVYAKELININKQYTKLHISKARIDSISMSCNEQWSMNKFKDSLHLLTGVMRDVNQLVNIGAVLTTMQELLKELMKAGIIDEMIDDAIDVDNGEELEDESQEEVDKIILNLTEKRKEAPSGDTIQQEETLDTGPVEEHAEEDSEALDEMKQRLKVLQE